VKVGMGDAEVTFDPGTTRLEQVIEAVEDEGYVAYRDETT
jgi:copper chaperone CopZ